jgi:hypothetical protein
MGLTIMGERFEDDSLDRQLREAAPYIEDDGFAARVVAKLPRPRQRHDSLRAIILIGLTALGSATAYVLSGGGRFITIEIARLTTLPTMSLYALALGSGILVMCAGTIAAIAKTNQLEA